jgi:hypothetical protein
VSTGIFQVRALRSFANLSDIEVNSAVSTAKFTVGFQVIASVVMKSSTFWDKKKVTGRGGL